MNRAARRISMVLGLAGIGLLAGCSSTPTAFRTGNYFVIQTADGGFVVGDSLGMGMRAAHDPVFAMAMERSYPDFDGAPANPYGIRFGATTLADVPVGE